MKSLATLFSQSDSEKYSMPNSPQKLNLKYSLIHSGLSPHQNAISLMIAYIFLRCSAEIVRPSTILSSISCPCFCASSLPIRSCGLTIQFYPSCDTMLADVIILKPHVDACKQRNCFAPFADTTIRHTFLCSNVYEELCLRTHIDHLIFYLLFD